MDVSYLHLSPLEITDVRLTPASKDNLVHLFPSLAQIDGGSTGATFADFPPKVTGTYADPRVSPDAEAVVKGELRQKLQEVLKKNGLLGLFGK